MKRQDISKLVQRILQMANRIIYGIENSRVPFLYFIFSFLFSVTLRNFLEPISTHGVISLPTLAHYYSFYIVLALALIVILRIATRSPMEKVARVVLVGYIVVFIPPVIDLLISGGAGLYETYLLPGGYSELFSRFFTFFGDYNVVGVTVGQRIEIGLVLVGSFLYIYTRNKKFRLIKGIGYTFLVYTTIFCFFITPFVIKAIMELFGLTYTYIEDSLYMHFYCAISIVLVIVIALLANKQYFLVILKDMRLLRLFYFLSMFAIGVSIGVSVGSFRLTMYNIFDCLFIVVSIICAFTYSVITNNFTDCDIDRITNPGRPLFNTAVNIDVYQRLAWIFLGLALFYSAIVNFTTLFIIVLFIGNYYLYSMPPVRFKRVTFFSKLAISMNSLALTLLGIFIITGRLYEVPDIKYPSIIFPVYLIGFTAMANMIDIKDYLGDKQSGIKTLPVIFGLARAKVIIGLFFVLAYGMLYFVVRYLNAPLYWFFIIMGLGMVQFILINWRMYRENAVFAGMLVTIWLIVYMILLYF